MSNLAKENLDSPNDIASKLSESEITPLLQQIPEWRISIHEGVERLERRFSFNNFSEALAFTDTVGAMADAVDHHPMLVTEWGKTTVVWWTHSHGGLLRNDFIMAARTDERYRP